jgi:acyl carrier protein
MRPSTRLCRRSFDRDAYVCPHVHGRSESRQGLQVFISATLGRARDNDGMRDRLLKVLKKVTTEPVNIGDEDSLFESGLLDSFALPDLVSGLEEEFSFKVPDADLNPRKFDSIARIEAYLAEHAKA